MEQFSRTASAVLSGVCPNVPYTIVQENPLQPQKSNGSFSWKNVNKDPLHLTIEVKNIVLKQDPSEVLDLEVRFDAIPTQNHCMHLYKIARFELKFHNNVHVFDSNYVYEVLCQNTDRTRMGFECPQEHLCSFAKSRFRKWMNGIEKCFSTLGKLSSEKLRFHIRRLYRFTREHEAAQYIDFRSLLQEVPTDVKLVVGGESLPAHQLVLSHSSQVFKAMFGSKMMEAETGVVKIDDFSVEVMKEMLNFLYTGNIDHVEMRYELLKVAHKYQLQVLFERCKEHVIFNANCESIAETLEIADLYDIQPLRRRALSFVKKHRDEMSEEPSYHDYLCRTMKLDNVVNTLLFAREYAIESITEKAIDFISENFCKLNGNEHFSKLFESDPSLMKEIFDYYCKNHTPTATSK